MLASDSPATRRHPEHFSALPAGIAGGAERNLDARGVLASESPATRRHPKPFSALPAAGVQQMCYFALLDIELLNHVLCGGNATTLLARDLACLLCTSKRFTRQTVERPARHLLRSMDPIFAAWLQAQEAGLPAAGRGWIELCKLCAFEQFAAQGPLSWTTSRLKGRCTFLQ